mmetsp:Transcript_11270/g.22143  ORF Transcript_11270/g.22143 Transcript_11270/m.22143 type:complete len:89 (+) Transcript_11270:134-400(+)
MMTKKTEATKETQYPHMMPRTTQISLPSHDVDALTMIIPVMSTRTPTISRIGGWPIYPHTHTHTHTHMQRRGRTQIYFKLKNAKDMPK